MNLDALFTRDEHNLKESTIPCDAIFYWFFVSLHWKGVPSSTILKLHIKQICNGSSHVFAWSLPSWLHEIGNVRRVRWQNKLHFPIHYIECDLCSTTSKPKENKDELLVIFNAISDALFKWYHNKYIAEDIWDTLEAKYMRTLHARNSWPLNTSFTTWWTTER